jgi:hypothetical protein
MRKEHYVARKPSYGRKAEWKSSITREEKLCRQVLVKGAVGMNSSARKESRNSRIRKRTSEQRRNCGFSRISLPSRKSTGKVLLWHSWPTSPAHQSELLLCRRPGRGPQGAVTQITRQYCLHRQQAGPGFVCPAASATTLPSWTAF